ncbi:hypothetical protein [Streptoalloteichus hindustanus]|uniref:Uncharacterized protein n=1 Tax=Streptoalloteichus hindustanus TaxID=2017 RepID=A0A1M5FG20_STRHI|nr:hypothetical protein [Streptoalloteichus hindustanus]SHF90443.1 hypothetical protein SAMN05444320_105424 [Streptoalloteichus hindustanus]
MARTTASAPPRPFAPGDVVAAFSDALGEWTAAQITDIDVDKKTAGVLELDWSGPEPTSVADLGEPRPFRPTHHNWGGELSHCNHEWVLPRSYKVLGALPLMHSERSYSYSSGWNLGLQLALQRHWDSGSREPWSDPRELRRTGAELNRDFDEQADPRVDVRRLVVTGVKSLDCDRLVQHFPGLTQLSLWGDMGLLSAPASLNKLASLKRVSLNGLFGMGGADRLLPERVPSLEALDLYNIPAEYAKATRSTWRAEIPRGTYLVISGARSPEWIAENRDNPLRDWDGRDNISGAQYRKAIAHYKSARRAIRGALDGPSTEDMTTRLFQIGKEYGEAFNRLDAATPFIETVEREELFDALHLVVREVETARGTDLGWARTSLESGVESVREW